MVTGGRMLIRATGVAAFGTLAVFALIQCIHGYQYGNCLDTFTTNTSTVRNCVIEIDKFSTQDGSRQGFVFSLLDLLHLREADTISLSDIVVSLASCSLLRTLAEDECTFALAQSWPSPGLQAGQGYLFYEELRSRHFLAKRVNVTCPHAEWETDTGGKGTTSGFLQLSPCGTAIVSSGEELLAALEELQRGYARVLITLAANMSIPADPTPQREEAPADDFQPLVRIYRNVTLAGATPVSEDQSSASGLHGGVELNLRMRRNVFDMRRTSLQQTPQPGTPYPVLVLSDLYLVNSAPGPPKSWPLGLLTRNTYYISMNRTSSAHLQLIALRSVVVLTPLETRYMGYWYNRMVSVDPKERASAFWLRQLSDQLQIIKDLDGHQTTWGYVETYTWAYNITLTPIPLVTPAKPADFDLWSVEPPSDDGGWTGAPLPPAHFAVAMDTAQLLRLLQEPWSSGHRVIFLLKNITLLQGDWPQDGASLSYNVTLLGPVNGPPVCLDLGGMELAQTAGAAGVGVVDSGVVIRNNITAIQRGSVSIQFQRLRLSGFTPKLLLTVNQSAVAAAVQEGAFAQAPELEMWSKSCMGSAPTGSAVGPMTEWMSADVRVELRKCSWSLPTAILDALFLANWAEACDAYRAASPAAVVARTTSTGSQVSRAGSPAAGPAGIGLCSFLDVAAPGAPPASLRQLLLSALKIPGKVAYMASSVSTQPPSILFLSVRLGNMVLINATAYPLPSISAVEEATSSSSEETAASSAACGLDSLLKALESLPSAKGVPPSQDNDSYIEDRNSGNTSQQAAIIGGTIGAVVGAALLGVSVALYIHSRHQLRKCQQLALTDLNDFRKSPAEAGPLQGTATDGFGPGMRGAEAAAASNTDAALAEAGSFSSGFTFTASALKGSAPGAAAARPAAQKQSTMADLIMLATGGGRGGLPGGNQAQDNHHAGITVLAKSPLQQAVSASSKLQKGAERPRISVMASLKGSIEELARKCQALATSAANKDSGPDSGRGNARRMPLLGRGGHGAVFLGDWRGLPAAIKVVMLSPTDQDPRHERLAREAALTTTLLHPNIVPTYHYSINEIRLNYGELYTLGRSMAARPATEQEQAKQQPAASDDDAGDDSDIAGLELRLVMQYCEGGTLGSSLRDGRFRNPLVLGGQPSCLASPQAAVVSSPPIASQADRPIRRTPTLALHTSSNPPQQSSSALMSKGTRHVQMAEPAMMPAAPTTATSSSRVSWVRQPDPPEPQEVLSRCSDGAAAPIGDPGETASTSTDGPHKEITFGVQQVASPSLQRPDKATVPLAGLDAGAPSQPAGPRGLLWTDLTAAANMPLALLAALDIARGLEYLHSCSVIHGDLTENNVLLKAVQPVMPPPPAWLYDSNFSAGQSNNRASTPSDCAQGGSTTDHTPSLTAVASTHTPEHVSGAMGSNSGVPKELEPAQQDPAEEGSTKGTSEFVCGAGNREQPRVAAATKASDGRCTHAHHHGQEQRQDQEQQQQPLQSQTPASPFLLPFPPWLQEPLQSLPRPQLQPHPQVQPTAQQQQTPEPQQQQQQPKATTCSTRPCSPEPSSSPVRLPPAGSGSLGKAHSSTAAVAAEIASMNQHGVKGFWKVGAQASGRGTPKGFGLQHSYRGRSLGTGMCGQAAASRGGSQSTDMWSNETRELWPGMFTGTESSASAVAKQLLSWTFKISDFGLSVQLHDPAQTHLSNMVQGTPFFTAPEVLQYGRLSTAADMYSFGVLLWLLLHGVSLRQVRHLLPTIPQVPVGPLLQQNISPQLPVAARMLLVRSLSLQAAQRPSAAELRSGLEAQLLDVCGPEVAYYLSTAERRDHALHSVDQ